MPFFYRRKVNPNQMMFSSGGGGGSAFTWDPANKGTNLNLANSNRDMTYTSPTGFNSVRSLGSKTSGQWYCEISIPSVVGTSKDWGIGIGDASFNLNTYPGASSTSCMYDFGNATTYVSGSGLANPNSAGTISPAVSDIIQLAIDIDTKKMWIGRNNTWAVGNPAVGTETNPWITWTTAFTVYVVGMQSDGSTGYQAARLSSTTTYSPPTGYSVLNA